MIRLCQVTKTYPRARRPAVDAVDLQVDAGQWVVLLGESGCGKTTTLKMINRLVEPTSGRILVDGRDVTAMDRVQLRRGIGYVIQGVGLFPHLSVAANVGITPQLLGWSRQEIRQRIDQLLEMVGLPAEEFRHRRPAELSGGQRQRVGVARALAARPSVLLMDEPFGALDPLTRDTLQVELKRLHHALDLTIVMVTHDMTEALLLADRIAVMYHGRIVQFGTPRELFNQPANPYVADLMASPKSKADQLESLASQGGS